jgi:phospholipid transport system substrate-binding protein
MIRSPNRVTAPLSTPSGSRNRAPASTRPGSALDRRRFLLASACCLAGIATRVSPTAAQSTQEEIRAFVQSLIDATIEILRLPADQKAERRSGFEKLLTTYFDVPYITEKVISRYWRQATPEQQSRFKNEFHNHILNVYTDRLGSYRDEKVTIRRVAPRNDAGTESIVFTQVDRGGDDPLALDWLVRNEANGPRIVDVAAEGVSLMQTKRSEFTTVIARDGLDALIDQLVQLNQQARNSDP